MKNDLSNLINKYQFKVNSYKRIGNVQIIGTDKGNFAIKRKAVDDKENLHNYLKSKQFFNYLPLHNDTRDDYEIVPFVENVDMSKEDKALNIIYIMSMLHNKTTFYKNISLDEIKEFYEDKTIELQNMNDYYDNIRMLLEEDQYVSPSNYLLLRSITLIYRAIDTSKYFLDKWYKLMEEKRSKRVVMLHNNLSLDHLVSSTELYLISWDKSTVDSPIYDFLNFYKNDYLEINFPDLFDIYNTKYKLLTEEKYLLFSLLSIPEKLELHDKEINNSKTVYELISYLYGVINFISENNPAYSNTKTN